MCIRLGTGMMEPAVNARIQDMRIVIKVSLSEEEAEFDGKSLSKEQMAALLEYCKTCTEPRGKEFLEMFFFAFHACGLRVVDVMTLQWKHIDFARKKLRKIMINLGAIFLLIHDGVFQGLEVATRGAEAAKAYPLFHKGGRNPVLLHETGKSGSSIKVQSIAWCGVWRQR